MIRLLLLALVILGGLLAYNKFVPRKSLSPEEQLQSLVKPDSGGVTGERLGLLGMTYPAVASRELTGRQLTLTGTVQTAFLSGMAQRKAGLQIFHTPRCRLLVVYDLDRDPMKPASGSSERQLRFLIENSEIQLVDPTRQRKAIVFKYGDTYSWPVVIKSITPNLILASALSYPSIRWQKK